MGPLGAARKRRAAEVRELREGIDRAMDLRAAVRRSAAAAGPAGPPSLVAAGAATMVLAQQEREVCECFASGEGARGVRRALEIQERFQSHMSLATRQRKPRCSDAVWQEELERLWNSAKGRPDWSEARLLAFLMGSRVPLSRGVSPLCHLPRDIVNHMVTARQS